MHEYGAKKRMKTDFTVLYPDGRRERKSVDWPEEPGYERIRNIVELYLDGGIMERVNVFWDEKYTDMFVDDGRHGKKLPRNEAATEIYLNNIRVHAPAMPIGSAHIVGPAVLFDRKVWF